MELMKKYGPSRIVLNVVVGVWLAMGLLLVQPVSAEEKVAEKAAEKATVDDATAASSAVSAPLVKGTLPADDPTAAVWNTAPPATFPMSPQVHWPVRNLEATVKDLIVRGLHDGTNIAILLEYADPTEDPDDAAAVQFMVGDKKAHFAHGQPMLQVEGGPVNIWYWKNKTGKGVDMNAKGFGTLKVQEHQDVSAKGVYSNGRWKVVFTRPLATEHPEEDTQITTAGFINIAFAVWDGKKDPNSGELKEKGSQKAVSSWWYFRAEAPPDYSGYYYAAIAVGLAVGFQFVLIRKLKKGNSA
jgi:DMSO reductase family type II enzyme heme b subunit